MDIIVRSCLVTLPVLFTYLKFAIQCSHDRKNFNDFDILYSITVVLSQLRCSQYEAKFKKARDLAMCSTMVQTHNCGCFHPALSHISTLSCKIDRLVVLGEYSARPMTRMSPGTLCRCTASNLRMVILDMISQLEVSVEDLAAAWICNRSTPLKG